MTAVKFSSKGESGNIFYILAMVKQEMQKSHRNMDFDELYHRVTNSNSYIEALAVIREYIKLEDTDKQY